VNLSLGTLLLQWRLSTSRKEQRILTQREAASRLAEAAGFPISLRSYSRWEGGAPPASKVKQHLILEVVLPEETEESHDEQA